MTERGVEMAGELFWRTRKGRSRSRKVDGDGVWMVMMQPGYLQAQLVLVATLQGDIS